MCLLLLALDSHPDYALIVAANRDEFYERPTAAAAFWAETPSVLGGRDLAAGGTWLGIDRQGRFAAVTNYRRRRREPPGLRSRGHLVADFLTSDVDGRTHIEQVERRASRYNGFNLIAGDSRGLYYFSNRDGGARTLTAGVYGLSNHLLDTAWPKVTSGKSGLNALVVRSDASDLIAELFRLLSDRDQAADHLLPQTGIAAEWERLLSSAFVVSSGYGTRSSTVVLGGRGGSVVFVERTFGSAGVLAGEVRHEFELHRAARSW